MTKKLAALGVVLLCLLSQRPHAQSPAPGHAGIYFIDIGQGASTLIVSPAGRTLLVDGGPPGAGTNAVIPLLNSLGISTIDYTVLTHYHIDHDGGLTEVINAGRIAGTAFDNGDAAGVIPPSLSGSTGQAYTAYKNALAAHGVARATITPGQVIDPGGGMTSTEKSSDVETWVGQLAGDVDVVQLDHHGSTSASNQRFLSALKAEVAVAQTGSDNTFGHPNRESVNKFLNTATTSGRTFTGTGVPAPGAGPVFYQIEQSSPADDRETQQGYYGAPLGSAGSGTILLQTDGTSTYSMFSINSAQIDP